jgi:hypothetical protein
MAYETELKVENYNETQCTVTFRGTTFFWPKEISIEWLTKWLIRESFEDNDSHNYFLLYTPKPDDVVYDMGA